MDTTGTVLGKIGQFKDRSAHWRKVHFHCARHYQWCDFVLSISSAVLTIAAMAFAFYSINRIDVPIWAQCSLASCAMVLGLVIAVQLYFRPATLSDSHREVAVGFGEMHRRWEFLETLCIKDPRLVTEQQVQQALEMGDALSGKAKPIPGHVLRRYGFPV